MAHRLYLAFIRWSFNRFYREFSWTYGAVAWLVSRGLWRRWTLESLPYLHGRILEVGCGSGYVQHVLARGRPGVAFGLDASRQMLKLTQRRVQQTHHDVRLVRGIAQNIPFVSKSFDTVLSTFPSEYILEAATLREIHRVLVNNGHLVIVDAANFTLDGLYERAIDLAYRITFQQPSVQKAPSSISYQDHLERVGFRVEVNRHTVGASTVLVMVCRAV